MKTSSLSPSKKQVPSETALHRKSAQERERIQFLNLRLLPARLSVQRAAWVLGLRPHEIQILVSYRLLKPIGTPARNAPKFFATGYIRGLAENYGWQDLSTATLQEYWKKKNRRRTTPGSSLPKE
jgi:hypothetical protein